MTETEIRQILKQRLEAVNKRIDAACHRAARASDEVLLVAVTKTVDSSVAEMLADLGVKDMGESRPQELWRKAAEVGRPVNWHLIGHLQRNKIERTLPCVHLIHSVDSLRLLEALEADATKQTEPLPILLEVNASLEAQKHGFSVEEVSELIPHLGRLKHVQVRGMMTMAALTDDAESARSPFRRLRELRDELAKNVPAPHELQELSMGMSSDFEVAIEEGATMIRVGSILFEGLPGKSHG